MARTTPTTTAKAAGRVTLEDLSVEDREALLAELEREHRATQKVGIAPDAPERELAAREVAVRALLRDRDHLDGCPVFGSTRGRVEAYSETRPANPAAALPAARMTVVRCIECGGSRVLEGPVQQVLMDALNDTAEQALDGSI